MIFQIDIGLNLNLKGRIFANCLASNFYLSKWTLKTQNIATWVRKTVICAPCGVKISRVGLCYLGRKRKSIRVAFKIKAYINFHDNYHDITAN